MSAPQFISRQQIRSLTTASTVVVFLVLLCAVTLAQSPPTPAPQQPGSTTSQQAPGSNDASPKPSPGAQVEEQPTPETHITKEQAKELFRSVDEILQFVSTDTGLPIQRKVKRNLITRSEVERYVDKRMKDDKDTQRLEQSQLVLEKFGLLPKGYDLHKEFLRLMGEQVAAFYEPKNESVNMLDWLPAETQKPVLAHELTHALQDQAVGLAKWELAGAKDDATPLPDPQEYVAEEAQSARQSVTEGEAQVVWFDYMLAPMGKSITTAPEFVDAMRAAMGSNKDSPIFAEAPVYLQETMLMPYTFGLDFVRTVVNNRGKEAFAELLHNPPIDTRQIMQPETYLMHQKVAPPEVPNFDALAGTAYERVDFGSMGEFDVYLLAKQYGADDTPNYYRHWRGGYYFAAHPKTAPKNQVALLYYSKWDSPEAARDFAKLYGDYLPKRYDNKLEWTKQCEPVNRDAKAAQDCNVMTGSTAQGPVLIEWHDNDLLVMEGYDQSVIDKARQVFFYGMSLPPAPSGKK
jgi:hypothetical protein